MASEEDLKNKLDHAKFLLFHLQDDINSTRFNKDCIIQCSDGSYSTSSLIIFSLSSKMKNLLKESLENAGNVNIIIPSLGLGELLLFFKYFFSCKVHEMFNKEDTVVIQKVLKELCIEMNIFESHSFIENHDNNVFQCIHCDNSFKEHEMLVKHALLDHPEHSANLFIQCKFCNEVFIEEEECHKHTETMHAKKSGPKDSEQKFRIKRLKEQEKLKCFEMCKFCQEIVNFSLIARHIKQKHPKNEQTCVNCDQRNESRESLESHVQIHKDSNIWYLSCERCLKVRLSQYQLQIHKKAHNIKQFGEMSCPHCDRVFKIADKFKKHVESHETGKFDKSFPCVHCNKSFKKQ